MSQKLENESCPIPESNLLPWIRSGEYLTPEWQKKLDEMIKSTTGSPEIPEKYLAVPRWKALI